jgi:hypothetical protein
MDFINEWAKLPRNLFHEDEYHSSYRGYEIHLSSPNQGIVSVQIQKPNSRELGWILDSDRFATSDHDYYGNEKWHIERAKEKIDVIFSTPKIKRAKKAHPLQLVLGF